MKLFYFYFFEDFVEKVFLLARFIHVAIIIINNVFVFGSL